MHSSIYKHENQINLNKRPVQKNRCKGRLFILIEQLNYLEAYSGSIETPRDQRTEKLVRAEAKTPILLSDSSRDLGLQVTKSAYQKSSIFRDEIFVNFIDQIILILITSIIITLTFPADL